MSHLFFYVLIFLVFLSPAACAQAKWDGGGGDNQWNNALNWSDDLSPVNTEVVVLDNSFVQGSYTVILPSGNVTVTVKNISISPAAGNNIELVLPEENTLVPGLVITGPGYGLDVHNGGIFRNSSGASSGTPVSVADSIRIRNGGRFVHNTIRAHAANMQVLSVVAGTEQGVVEFDVPALSSTISLSGRTYGKLVLKSDAVAGGALKYTAAGTSGVIIRSDFVIDAGVTCGLNFSDTITVGGDLIENGTFDMGNTARNVVLAVKGNIIQPLSGTITESGTGSQEIMLNGNASQKINMLGGISNTIVLTINSAGVTLQSPLVLSYKLSLLKGRLTSTSASMLVLAASCSVSADTLTAESFINGPLKKSGLANDDFVFPVGKGMKMRWLALKNATGDFTVEYNQADPYTLNNTMGSGINHVSHIEYWSVSGIGAPVNAVTTLSFSDPGSGGVTSLSDLRVARLTGDKWENAGNTAVGGSAGADGWVSSTAASGFSANSYFALASAIGQENPLPFSSISLKAESIGNNIRFNWNIKSDADFYKLELQRGVSNNNFITIREQFARKGVTHYKEDISENETAFFRVRAADAEEKCIYSNVVPAGSVKKKNDYCISGENLVMERLNVTVTVPGVCRMNMAVYNSSGYVIKQRISDLPGSSSEQHFSVAHLLKGMYYLIGTTPAGRTNVFRFIKL